MKMKQLSFMLASLLLLVSCNSKKHEYDPYNISGGKAKQEISKNAFEIDFKQTAGKLKTIHINLGGSNSYDAIFDTGCSGVSISTIEAIDMFKQGTLRAEDERTPDSVQIADGSVSERQVFKLREVTVVDKNGQPHTLRDVDATVEPNLGAPILIGSSVIDNYAKKSYTVDLKKKIIRFE